MKTQKTKQKIIEALEGKKVMPIKVKFKSRLKLFWIGWKYTKKFLDYSLWKELKMLFTPYKYEVMIK